MGQGSSTPVNAYTAPLERVTADRSGKPKGILLVGLDGVGKSSFLFKLVENQPGFIKQMIPTIGMNIKLGTLFKKVGFLSWNLGGSQLGQLLWGHFYVFVNAMIFVVDSGDRERIEDANRELHKSDFNPTLTLTLIRTPTLTLTLTLKDLAARRNEKQAFARFS